MLSQGMPAHHECFSMWSSGSLPKWVGWPAPELYTSAESTKPLHCRFSTRQIWRLKPNPSFHHSYQALSDRVEQWLLDNDVTCDGCKKLVDVGGNIWRAIATAVVSIFKNTVHCRLPTKCLSDPNKHAQCMTPLDWEIPVWLVAAGSTF